jgi:hypothetical protein
LPHSTNGCSPAGCPVISPRSVVMSLRLNRFGDFDNPSTAGFGLKKKLGLTLASAKEERGRVYRIADPANL